MNSLKQVRLLISLKWSYAENLHPTPNFEEGSKCICPTELTNFNVAALQVFHMNEVDKKRKAVEDKIEALRFESEYFGDKGQRYDLELEVIDVKYIQSSSVYMITTVQNSKNIVKFWWRDHLILVISLMVRLFVYVAQSISMKRASTLMLKKQCLIE